MQKSNDSKKSFPTKIFVILFCVASAMAAAYYFAVPSPSHSYELGMRVVGLIWTEFMLVFLFGAVAQLICVARR